MTDSALTRIVFSSANPAGQAAFYRALLAAELQEQDWGGFAVWQGTMAGLSVCFVPADITGITAQDNRHQLGFSVADLRAAREAGLAGGGTVDAGWEVQSTPAGGLTAAIRDADGNSVELFQARA